MNIGVVVDNIFFNDERVKREVNILKNSFEKVYVLCFDFGDNIPSKDDNIIVDQIKIKRKHKDLLVFIQNWIPKYESIWAKEIARFINENDLNIIHAHDLYMAKAARKGIQKSGRNCKLIIDLHENYPEVVKSYSWTKGLIRKPIARAWAWEKKEHEYLSCADKIIVLSESFKSQLLDKYNDLDKNNFTVFPNVPDLQTLELYNSIETTEIQSVNHPVFFYFGVIGKRRGILQTLRVFKEYIRSGSTGTLLLIGPVDKYDQKTFFSETKNKEIASSIKYIPWINIDQLPSYMKDSDICLAPFEKNPQHESGISNKIYQYMYGEKAIISSNCKPQQELIEKYNFGLIFSDDQEYLEAMIQLGRDKNLQQQMGANAYKALISNYNLENFKSVIINLYKRLEKEINLSDN